MEEGAGVERRTLSAGLDENAEVSDTLVERLGALAETASESVVDEGVLEASEKGKVGRQHGLDGGRGHWSRSEGATHLENLLEGLLNGGGTASGGGGLSDLNLLNGVNGLGSSVSCRKAKERHEVSRGSLGSSEKRAGRAASPLRRLEKGGTYTFWSSSACLKGKRLAAEAEKVST